MFLKKILFIFLFLLSLDIFAFGTVPYTLGFELKDNLLHTFDAKNVLSIDSNYSYNLLKLTPSTELIKHSVKQTFYFSITKSFFTAELNLSFFPFINGETQKELIASEGMSDSLFNLWFNLYKNSKISFFTGLLFSLPSGNPQKFTGEGRFKSGLLFKISGEYFFKYFFISSIVFRKPVYVFKEKYSHEIFLALNLRYEYKFFDTFLNFSHSSDVEDFFDKNHIFSNLKLGTKYKKFKYIYPGISFSKGFGDAPYTSFFSTTIFCEFYNLF